MTKNIVKAQFGTNSDFENAVTTFLNKPDWKYQAKNSLDDMSHDVDRVTQSFSRVAAPSNLNNGDAWDRSWNNWRVNQAADRAKKRVAAEKHAFTSPYDYTRGWRESTEDAAKLDKYTLEELGASEEDAQKAYDDFWKNSRKSLALGTGITLALPTLGALSSGALGLPAADITNGIFAADAVKNLASDEGVAKTYRLAKNGDTWGAIKSGAWDALDLSMLGHTIGMAGRVGKSLLRGSTLRNAYIGDVAGRTFNTAVNTKYIPASYENGGIIKAQKGKVIKEATKAVKSLTEGAKKTWRDYEGLSKLDTSLSDNRDAIVSAFKERYPSFIETPTEGFKLGTDKYYLVGKLPMTDDTRIHKDLLKSRLTDFYPDFKERSFRTITREGDGLPDEWVPGDSLISKLGTEELGVVIPYTKNYTSLYYDDPWTVAGFVPTEGRFTGRPFVTANSWGQPISTIQVHEALSHGSDGIIAAKSPKLGTPVSAVYKAVAEPTDLFDDLEYVTPKASDWWEARATNHEMIHKINEIIAKRKGISLEEAYKHPEFLNEFVDTDLGDTDKLIDFLGDRVNDYAHEYEMNLRMHRRKNPQTTQTYADRIRSMIKTLPAVAAPIVGAAVIGKQPSLKNPSKI